MNSDEPNGLGLLHHLLLIAPGGSFCVSESRSECSALWIVTWTVITGSLKWWWQTILLRCSLVERFSRRRTTTWLQIMQKPPEWCMYEQRLDGTWGLLPCRSSEAVGMKTSSCDKPPCQKWLSTAAFSCIASSWGQDGFRIDSYADMGVVGGGQTANALLQQTWTQNSPCLYFKRGFLSSIVGERVFLRLKKSAFLHSPQMPLSHHSDDSSSFRWRMAAANAEYWFLLIANE